MYLLTASIWCTNLDPMTLIGLDIKRENATPIITRNINLGNNNLLQASIYFGPNDFTFPITDLIIEWDHNSQTEQVGISLFASNFNYTYAILQFLD
jgi:hypothetical protein